jgi:hypothetical protein
VTLRARVAFAALALFLSIAYVPFFAGDIAKWTVLFVSVGFLAFLPIRIDRIDLSALAFVAWAWVSLLWSPDPMWGAVWGLKITTLALLFIGLRRIEVPDWVVPLGVLGTLGMLFVALYGSFQNENFTTEYLLVALPFLLVRRIYWPIAALVLTYLLWFNESLLEWVALGAILLWGLWRWNRLIALVGALAGVAGVLSYYTGDSLWFRVDMWTDTLVMWTDAPLWGHGLGSFNYLYPWYETASPFGLEQFFNAQMWAVAAHNEYLQVLAELGTIGLALAGFFVWQVRSLGERPPVATAALVIAAALAFFESPLQHPGTGALVVLGFAMLTPRYAENVPKQGAIKSIGATFSAAALVTAFFMAMGNWFYERADNIVDIDPQRALVEIVHAYNWFPADLLTRQIMFRYLVRLQTTVPAQINYDLAEGMWQISKSAMPGHPQLLLDRIGYLSRVGRCEEECGEIYQWLLRYAPHVGEVQRLKQEMEL